MKKQYLTRLEAARELGINPNMLKHQISSRYKGKKPPHKKIGRTTVFGPVAALHKWFNSDLELENNSAKSATSLKIVK